jgi:hypothetical protein
MTLILISQFPLKITLIICFVKLDKIRGVIKFLST